MIMSIINNKGFYLKTMLEDFFQYSKLNSNDWTMEKMDINLNKLVLQLVNCEESSFIKKGLQLDVNLYNKKLLILGDPTLISRAFSNLISNALKYSKENSKVEVSIKETLVSSVKYGVFTVKNTPKEEISKQELNNFFKRLYNGITYSLIFGVISMIYSMSYPETITSLFSNDTEVIKVSSQYLMSYSIDCVMVSFVFCINGYLSGLGKSTISLIHSLIATNITNK